MGAGLVPLVLAVLALALPAAAGAVTPETGRISGTVTDEGGEPIEGVSVCAEESDGVGYAGECDRTRADGTYELSALPVGEYKVEFWSPGQIYLSQFWEDAPSWSTATPVLVSAGAVTPEIDAVLERGASISGKVTAAATGSPVQWVYVCATSTTTEAERCGETDAAGEYTIGGLSQGSWNVYFYTYETEADVISAPYAGGPVTLNAKEAKTGINQALVAGGQIAGTVRAAATGAPLSGVLVCITEASYPKALACLHTPASGGYRFTGIWNGSFKIAYSPELKEVYEPEWVEYIEEEEAKRGLKAADSYATQWWNGASTFTTATPIAIVPPAQVTGIDGSLVAATAPPAAIVPPVVTKPVTKPVLKCSRGFVKRRIKCKARCVKRKKKPKHHQPAKHHHQPVHANQSADRR